MFKEVHNKGVGVKNVYQIGNIILSLRSREGQGEVKKENQKEKTRNKGLKKVKEGNTKSRRSGIREME